MQPTNPPVSPKKRYTMNILKDVNFGVIKSLNSTDRADVPSLAKPAVLLIHATWPGFSGPAVMKVWHWHDTSTHPLVVGVRRQFSKEEGAYARLIKEGLDQEGLVPTCYGKFRFPKYWKRKYLSEEQDEGHELLKPFFLEQPPMALILEYCEETKPLHTMDHQYSDDFIDRVIDVYRRIHLAGIYQCDHDIRNILVTASGRPAIIDFHAAYSLPDIGANEEAFAYEADCVRALLKLHRSNPEQQTPKAVLEDNGTDASECGSVASERAFQSIGLRDQPSIAIPLMIIGGGIPIFQLAAYVLPSILNAIMQWRSGPAPQ